MVIDTLGSIPSPQFADISVERQPEPKDTRAIEESEGSDDTQLDANRQENTEQQAGGEIFMSGASEMVTYDSSGKMANMEIDNDPANKPEIDKDENLKPMPNKVVIG